MSTRRILSGSSHVGQKSYVPVEKLDIGTHISGCKKIRVQSPLTHTKQ